MIDTRKIRLVFTNKVYKKKGNIFIIPIAFVNNRYITGQADVPFDIATGKTIPTPELAEKYPFIIDPTESYKAFDLKFYDLSLVHDKAMYELMILSKRIAKSKSVYDKDPGKFDGYFEDKTEQAKINITKRNKRFEAESLVKSLSIDELKNVALLLNFKSKHFKANVNDLTSEEILDRLYTEVDERVDSVLSCFEKFNPYVKDEMFAIKLIHKGILRKDAEGHLYDGKEYICNSITSLREFTSKDANGDKLAKWANILKDTNHVYEIKGNLKSEIDYISKVKLALFDKNLEYANDLLIEVKRLNEVEMINTVEGLIEQYKEDHQEKQFIVQSDLEEKTLEELQKMIRNPRSQYKAGECRDFIDNKEKLIEYMITK